MPSDAKKHRDAKKKEAAKLKAQKKPIQKTDGAANGEANLNGDVDIANGSTLSLAEDEFVRRLEREMNLTAEARSCTGVLAVHPRSRDIRIDDNFSINFHGVELLADTKLELNCGRWYGLVGANGSGKSTLLAALGRREVPVQSHIDIYHLTREMAASEKTALAAVMEVGAERVRLEKLVEEFSQYDDEESQDQLMDVYDDLDEIGADTAEAKAAYILHGLGFSKSMQQKMCKDFSGEWRMKIALARALFVKPHLLLLDEPTNHLDLDACVWLEEELKEYKRILVVISHSQDFLNGVCTNIIHLDKRKLKYYGPADRHYARVGSFAMEDFGTSPYIQDVLKRVRLDQSDLSIAEENTTSNILRLRGGARTHAFIREPHGQVIPIDLDPKKTLLEIQEAVEKQTGIAMADQYVSFGQYNELTIQPKVTSAAIAVNKQTMFMDRVLRTKKPVDVPLAKIMRKTLKDTKQPIEKRSFITQQEALLVRYNFYKKGKQYLNVSSFCHWTKQTDFPVSTYYATQAFKTVLEKKPNQALLSIPFGALNRFIAEVAKRIPSYDEEAFRIAMATVEIQ